MDADCRARTVTSVPPRNSSWGSQRQNTGSSGMTPRRRYQVTFYIGHQSPTRAERGRLRWRAVHADVVSQARTRFACWLPKHGKIDIVSETFRSC